MLFDPSQFTPEGAKFIGEVASAELQSLTQHSSRANPATPLSICRTEVQFVEGDRWHACEPGGRWLHRMSGTVRSTFVLGTKSLTVRGFTFGVQRRMKVFVNQRLAHDALVDTVDIKITLTEGDISPLDVKFEFEGPPPFSPKSIGVSGDERDLNFVLVELIAGR